MEKDKWEYREVDNKDIIKGTITLSQLAAEGWELVKIVGLCVYLRRRKQEIYKQVYDD